MKSKLIRFAKTPIGKVLLFIFFVVFGLPVLLCVLVSQISDTLDEMVEDWE